MNEDSVFNIVSNITSDNPYIVNIGEAGLLVIEESGILLEVELLFIQPLIHRYHFIDCTKISHGVPYFDNQSIEKNVARSPLLYIDKEEKKGLFFLNADEKNIDEIVVCNNIRFLFSNKNLVGIEVFNLDFDIDDHNQKMWLQHHNINN